MEYYSREQGNYIEMILNSAQAKSLMDWVYMLPANQEFRTSEATQFSGLASKDTGIVINQLKIDRVVRKSGTRGIWTRTEVK